MADDCLDDNRAAEFASGTLAPAAAAKVDVHLAGCRDCREVVAALAGGASDSDSDLATAPRAEPRSAATELEVSTGDRMGRYLVIGKLGLGGMGVVFSAYDPQLDRRVAIKLLRGGTGLTSTEGRARLIREAKAIAQLSHPNVVAVYDVGTAQVAAQDSLYIAMELVEGDTFTHWLRRWPRPWREVVDVMVQAGRGLGAAHAVGLLHRDFKPDNVLVGDDGRVRVGDFGLARSVVGPDVAEPARDSTTSGGLHSSLTATGTVLGTPRFMAPEQFRGDDTDARSDQFSFCVALYDAIYGRHPLLGESASSMAEHGTKALPPPDGTKVPPAIGRAILRGLEPLPSRRFPSMQSLLNELTPPPVRPRKVAVLLLGGLALSTITIAAVVSRSPDVPRTTSPDVTELKRQVAVLKLEVKDLLARLSAQDLQLEQLPTLREELQLKNQQIVALTGDIATIRQAATRPASVAPSPAAPPRIETSLDEKMLAAVRFMTADLSACFQEWEERSFDKTTPLHDTTLNTEVTVNADGSGRAVRSTGQGSLPICVRDVLTRAPYPATGNLLRLVVKSSFRTGAVVLELRVVKAIPESELIDSRT